MICKVFTIGFFFQQVAESKKLYRFVKTFTGPYYQSARFLTSGDSNFIAYKTPTVYVHCYSCKTKS